MRVLGALLVAFRSFFRAAWRAIRQLFHEITGVFFVVFAVIGGTSAWRYWKRGAGEWLIGLCVAFALVMAAFAVSAFRSARRVR